MSNADGKSFDGLSDAFAVMSLSPLWDHVSKWKYNGKKNPC